IALGGALLRTCSQVCALFHPAGGRPCRPDRHSCLDGLSCPRWCSGAELPRLGFQGRVPAEPSTVWTGRHLLQTAVVIGHFSAPKVSDHDHFLPPRPSSAPHPASGLAQPSGPSPSPTASASAQRPHPAQRPSQHRCTSQTASVQTLAQQHEYEVVEPPQSKTITTIGEGLDFIGALVAATFVIAAEILTLVDHAHPPRVLTPPFGGPRLGEVDQRRTQPLALPLRR